MIPQTTPPTNEVIVQQLGELSKAIQELKTYRPARRVGLEWGSLALAVLAAGTIVYNAGTVSTRIGFLEKSVSELTSSVKELQREVSQMRVDIARLVGSLPMTPRERAGRRSSFGCPPT
jgi:uncharacterized coiled-coil protein SlyX